MTAKERRFAATAHHEAGHAVASCHLRLRFERVTIKPQDDSLGRVSYESPSWLAEDYPDVTRRRAKRDIIVSYAGQIAEEKFRGCKPRYGADGDNQNIAELAFRSCGSAEMADAFLRECFAASTDVVNNRWKEIQAVAAALLERSTLTYKETIEVITPGATALKRSLERSFANPTET